MFQFVKTLPKVLLRRFNRTLCYTPYAITGCHFADDIRKLVVKKAPVCIDVGAHWGETVNSLAAIFERPTIYAFEPSHESFKRLVQNPNILPSHCFQLAMGESDQDCRLKTFEDTFLNSILELHADGGRLDSPMTGTETVEMIRFDTFFQRHKLGEVDLLKIDTQGYELTVLKGAEASLLNGSIRNVLLEVNFANLYKGQSAASDIFQFLASCGYGFVDFYHKARTGHRMAWCNALFTRIND